MPRSRSLCNRKVCEKQGHGRQVYKLVYTHVSLISLRFNLYTMQKKKNQCVCVYIRAKLDKQPRYFILFVLFLFISLFIYLNSIHVHRRSDVISQQGYSLYVYFAEIINKLTDGEFIDELDIVIGCLHLPIYSRNNFFISIKHILIEIYLCIDKILVQSKGYFLNIKIKF